LIKNSSCLSGKKAFLFRKALKAKREENRVLKGCEKGDHGDCPSQRRERDDYRFTDGREEV